MSRPPRNMLAHQRGATLLVAMIFLIILTLIVVSSVRTTNVNTRVVGSMQTQKEAEAAAQLAIEREITGGAFATLLSEQESKVDINNSGNSGATYKVVVKPTCVASKKVPPGDLDPINRPADAECLLGGRSRDPNIPPESLCRDAMWDLEAVVTDPQSGKSVTTIHQGVAQRNPGASC